MSCYKLFHIEAFVATLSYTNLRRILNRSPKTFVVATVEVSSCVGVAGKEDMLEISTEANKAIAVVSSPSHVKSSVKYRYAVHAA